MEHQEEFLAGCAFLDTRARLRTEYAQLGAKFDPLEPIYASKAQFQEKRARLRVEYERDSKIRSSRILPQSSISSSSSTTLRPPYTPCYTSGVPPPSPGTSRPSLPSRFRASLPRSRQSLPSRNGSSPALSNSSFWTSQ
jgi:hypothetical protein